MFGVGSDRRAKTGIEGADPNIEQFLDGIDAYRYSYKDPQRHGQGERVGRVVGEIEPTLEIQRIVFGIL